MNTYAISLYKNSFHLLITQIINEYSLTKNLKIQKLTLDFFSHVKQGYWFAIFSSKLLKDIYIFAQFLF